jgi:hypothetical protein
VNLDSARVGVKELVNLKSSQMLMGVLQEVPRRIALVRLTTVAEYSVRGYEQGVQESR